MLVNVARNVYDNVMKISEEYELFIVLHEI